MNRKVLLVEPNYKNKYPPMGLMKLATYYRECGDDVRFFKGDMRDLATELICEDMLERLCLFFPSVFWQEYYPVVFEFIKNGKYGTIEGYDVLMDANVRELLVEYRAKYKNKEYFERPRFDKVGIATLFTFYWDITIDTINFAKRLCKDEKGVMIGGIMASLLPDEIFDATGIRPHVGLLSRPGVIDNENNLIIDELPLDYSILEEIDYVYPANNAYFSYMTRGCVNKCRFCAVPKLEPVYIDYITLRERIKHTDERFGERKDLLLLDNNVLASKSFEKVIDEIRDCGFGVGATYSPPNEYDIMMRNLRDSYNNRAYIRKAVAIYLDLMERLKDDSEKKELYLKLSEAHCLHTYTASRDAILNLDAYVRPLYEKTHKSSRRKRIVDFNQGIDARLVTPQNMKKLATVNIYPLRIAFDHWKLAKTYERAIRNAAAAGIKNLSNYLLYNFEDKPEDLYRRLRMNVDLCEELKVSIYSFPMKYHPINDKEFFMNRDYIGEHWNRKFIRAVQAVLNSTKGKIGRGLTFFEEAFGRTVEEFREILWMPETFIIYRRVYDADLRARLAERYTTTTENDNDMANEWRRKFNALSSKKRKLAESIIAVNKFKPGDYECDDLEVKAVLSYYAITR